MSWSMTEIETALLDALKAGVAESDVRTWETELREVLFTGEQLSKGFRPEECPAVMITTSQDPVRSTMHTASREDHRIVVQVLIVTTSTVRDQARQTLLGLMSRFARAINQARCTNGLGNNAYVVDEILGSHVVVQDRPRHYGVGNITLTVMKVVDL